LAIVFATTIRICFVKLSATDSGTNGVGPHANKSGTKLCPWKWLYHVHHHRPAILFFLALYTLGGPNGRSLWWYVIANHHSLQELSVRGLLCKRNGLSVNNSGSISSIQLELALNSGAFWLINANGCRNPDDYRPCRPLRSVIFFYHNHVILLIRKWMYWFSGGRGFCQVCNKNKFLKMRDKPYAMLSGACSHLGPHTHRILKRISFATIYLT